MQATQSRIPDNERVALIRLTESVLREQLLPSATAGDDEPEWQAIRDEAEVMASAARVRALLERGAPVEDRLLARLAPHIDKSREEFEGMLNELADDNPPARAKWEQELAGYKSLYARLRPDASCAGCGAVPATKRDTTDSHPQQTYCDLCAARMDADDSGEMYGMVMTAAFALTRLSELLRDPAELRRVTDEVLDDVLNGYTSANTIDVPAFTSKPRFEPLVEPTI